jgi:hypothetical protein
MSTTLMKLRNPRWGTPKWFDKFVDDIGGEISLHGDSGFDHPRGYKNVAILQPYHAKGEALGAFLAACKEHGLKVFISGKTNYYPSATFTIVIYKPEDEIQMQEFVHEALETNIKVPVGLS